MSLNLLVLTNSNGGPYILGSIKSLRFVRRSLIPNWSLIHRNPLCLISITIILKNIFKELCFISSNRNNTRNTIAAGIIKKKA